MLLYVQKTITTAKDTCEIPGDVTANDAVPAQLDSWKKIVGTHTHIYIFGFSMVSKPHIRSS